MLSNYMPTSLGNRGWQMGEISWDS